MIGVALLAALTAVCLLSTVLALSEGAWAIAGASGLASAFFGAGGWNILQYRFRRKPSVSAVALAESDGQRVVRVPYSPAGFIASTVALSALAAGALWLSQSMAATGVWVIAVVSGLVGLWTSLYVVVGLMAGVRGGEILLSSSRVLVRRAAGEESLAWDDIRYLDPHLRPDDRSGLSWSRWLDLVAEPGVLPARRRRTSWLQGITRGRSSPRIEMWLEGLDVDPVVSLHLIRFYLQNPALRGELGTEASISRVRRRDLPGGYRPR